MISGYVDTIGIILLVAVLIGAVSRDRGWNAALILLGSGLLLGWLPVGPDAPPDPELVLVLILAPLVFGEALSSSAIDIRRVARPVTALAVALVLLTAGAVGYLSTLLLPSLPLASALCLGAVLGPTDAVAVAATAKSAGLPRRLVNVLEGESLLNDGTALTLLRVCATAAAAGSLSAGEVSLLVVQSVLGGVVAGLVGGLILGTAAARVRDTIVTNGVLLVFPLPLYAAAEFAGGSGILAVVIAAFIFAHRTTSTVSYAGRLQATSIWRAFGFVLQSAAFFLVGMEMPDELRSLDSAEVRVLAVFVPVVIVVLIGLRFAFVWAMTRPALGWRGHHREWVLVAWAGTRGPISVLAAFTLPLTLDDGSPFPDRSLMISATFLVVLVSMLLSPTIPAVARALRLPPDDDPAVVRRVRVHLARASMNRLEELADAAERSGRPLPQDLLHQLRGSAEVRLNRSARAEERGAVHSSGAPANRKALLTEMAGAEQEELLRLRDEEELPDALMRSLQLELDTRLRALHLDR